MFEHAKAITKRTLHGLKTANYIRNILTQIIFIAYLVYTLCAKIGFPIANGILLTLSVAYLIFFLYVTKFQTEKKIKRTVKLLFKHAKRFVRFLNLGIAIYGICLTAQYVTPFAVVLLALMFIGWVLQIVFELLIQSMIKHIENYVEKKKSHQQ